jgi:rSAM/selenodomain-associated transferase 1
MNTFNRVLDPSHPGGIPEGFCALAVMTKVPLAGQVKTRLIPPLTPQEAAELNRCFLRDTTTAIASTTGEERTRGVAVFTPVGAEREYVGIVPEEFDLLPQRGEALEERIVFAIEDLLSLGFASVCLINSDSPTVPPRAFAEAARILARKEADVVLGPSEDGGYYLIGLNQLHRTLFKDISWSTELVLEQTSERARAAGLELHFLPTWYDVDDSATLHRLCRDFFTDTLSRSEAYPAPATREYLKELLKREGRDRIWPDE